MNRFIEFAKRSQSVPFQIAIYRDDRTYSGYATVCFSKTWTALRSRQVTQDRLFDNSPVRKLNGTKSWN